MTLGFIPKTALLASLIAALCLLSLIAKADNLPPGVPMVIPPGSTMPLNGSRVIILNPQAGQLQTGQIPQAPNNLQGISTTCPPGYTYDITRPPGVNGSHCAVVGQAVPPERANNPADPTIINGNNYNPKNDNITAMRPYNRINQNIYMVDPVRTAIPNGDFSGTVGVVR